MAGSEVGGEISVFSGKMHIDDGAKVKADVRALEEVSALGAACLAGLQQNIFSDTNQLTNLTTSRKQFTPNTGTKTVNDSYEGWKKAVKQLL